jgi:hypothetical protein
LVGDFYSLIICQKSIFNLLLMGVMYICTGI